MIRFLFRLVKVACVAVLFVNGFFGMGRTLDAQPKPAPAKAENEPLFFTPPGFPREGKPVLASGDKVGRVHILVRDQATGKPTFCRINVVGVDGHFYQPAANYLSTYALTGSWPKAGSWGNRPHKAPYRYLGRFFYSWGDTTVAVPPGPVRIEVWKGLEYRPQVVSTKVPMGVTKTVEATVARSLSMAKQGYYGGDPHLHFPRVSNRDEDTIFDLLAAEDIQFGSILGYNHPAGPYAGFMEKMAAPQLRGLGVHSARKRGNYHIISGQEYRTGTYGHLNLYLRDDIVFKGQSFNANNWPVYGEVGKETMAQGGFALYAHGGYAQEIYADAALGTVNGVELLQFGIYRGIGLEDWYHILNTGYRFPCAGASDYPACRFLGDCRTYVHHPTPPSFPQWLEGLFAGRSFVTTGPMLLLEVDGQKPGSIIEPQGPGPHRLGVKVRLRCEVTPVTNLDLIVNGACVLHKTLAQAKTDEWFELEHTLEIKEPSWIAARAYSTTAKGQPDAEAHTNPVYVYIAGRRPYRQAALDAWVARIDKQIAVHAKRTFAEKARVLTYFQQARDKLLAIRQAGSGKGVRTLFPERPEGGFAQKVPDPFSGSLFRLRHWELSHWASLASLDKLRVKSWFGAFFDKKTPTRQDMPAQ